ncbi:MAG: IS5 family transposase [Nitrososphaeraceae archaeon]
MSSKCKGKKIKNKRNWKEYNESLIKRGEIIFDTDFLSNWQAELVEMNRKKKGAKYRYPNSLIWLLATVHVYLLPYRQLEGFLNVMSEHIPRLKEKVPDYTTMWWRVVKIKIALKPEINQKEKEGILTIAVDSTGIKVTNRGEWIRDKWKERRGFIKIHVAVNVKTKQILSMEVTKEDVADGKMLKPLVHHVTTSASFPYATENRIIEVIADGTYDSKDNFRYLNELKMKPVIKVRRNSSTNANGCIPRKLVVVEQLDNVKRWKKKHGYGMRWIAESAFSSIKRTFGEYVMSLKWENIINELFLKASLYNMFISKMK